MNTIYLTDKDDDNTTVWYLTNGGDVVGKKSEFDLPAYKVITHGMYVGTVNNWIQWIKSELSERGYYVFDEQEQWIKDLEKTS